METFLFFFVHYGLPTICVGLVLLHEPQSKVGLWSAASMCIGILLFLFYWGQWPLVGSYYFRYLALIGVLVVIRTAINRSTSGRPFWHAKIASNLAAVATLIMASGVVYLLSTAIQGLRYNEPAVELTFPLKNGTYYVSSGGSTKTINNHMRSFPNAQEYALDINKLGKFGGASKKLFGGANENHHIFGEQVYAPCDGVVITATNDIADNIGSSMDVGAEDGTGNHLSIRCDKNIVSMSHLQQGSLEVNSGNSVVIGQPLARVGNSGFSQEPHLHLQLAKPDGEDRMVGVPMRFDGNALVRNELLDNRAR